MQNILHSPHIYHHQSVPYALKMHRTHFLDDVRVPSGVRVLKEGYRDAIKHKTIPHFTEVLLLNDSSNMELCVKQ